MNLESWLKVGLPAFPALFTIFGVWGYWNENPLPVLAPAVGFWGVVLLYYLFSNLVVSSKNYPLFLIICTTALWVVSSITSHNLGKFLASAQHVGFWSVVLNKDFRYAYICAVIGALVGFFHFRRYEPEIVKELKRTRERLESMPN
jgi:hypothetical protein